MKTLILVQSTIAESFQNVIKASLDTWIKNTDIPVILYQGTPSDNPNYVLSNQTLTVPARDESTHCINNKVYDYRAKKYILALEYCYNNFDFDFLYRTTCTTYINTDRLKHVMPTLNPFKTYDGARNLTPSGKYFVGSYNCMLSRDVVELVLKHQQIYLDLNENEDVALGVLLFNILKCIDPIESFNSNFMFESSHDNIHEYKLDVVAYKHNHLSDPPNTHPASYKNMYALHEIALKNRE